MKCRVNLCSIFIIGFNHNFFDSLRDRPLERRALPFSGIFQAGSARSKVTIGFSHDLLLSC